MLNFEFSFLVIIIIFLYTLDLIIHKFFSFILTEGKLPFSHIYMKNWNK